MGFLVFVHSPPGFSRFHPTRMPPVHYLVDEDANAGCASVETFINAFWDQIAVTVHYGPKRSHVRVFVPFSLPMSAFCPYVASLLGLPPIDNENVLAVFSRESRSVLEYDSGTPASKVCGTGVFVQVFDKNADLGEMRLVDVVVMAQEYRITAEFQTVVGVNTTFEHVVEIARNCGFLPDDTEPLRCCFQLEHAKLLGPVEISQFVGPKCSWIRIDVVPRDQREMADARLCQVIFFKKQVRLLAKWENIGIPFIFRVVRGETVGEFKARIRQKFGFSSQNPDDLRVMAPDRQGCEVVLGDDAILSDTFWEELGTIPIRCKGTAIKERPRVSRL
jgi:hypothetical protein